jgi:uncharacterized membrane protein YfcA
MLLLAGLFIISLWAGMQNAFAGGGTFITLPALMLTGMDARAANITSTIALFPAQAATGWTGRKNVSGAAGLSFLHLMAISLVGGVAGAVLLLVTPSDFFARLVPWLVLFATVVFAWGSFFRKAQAEPHLGRAGAGITQFLISVYGGYFGGGIGFLMLAALTAAGLLMRNAGATKNTLAGVMNASAVLIFLFSPEVRWLQAGIASAGAIAGGVMGGLLLHKLNERVLRLGIVVIGIALSIGLFFR